MHIVLIGRVEIAWESFGFSTSVTSSFYHVSSPYKMTVCRLEMDFSNRRGISGTIVVVIVVAVQESRNRESLESAEFKLKKQVSELSQEGKGRTNVAFPLTVISLIRSRTNQAHTREGT